MKWKRTHLKCCEVVRKLVPPGSRILEISCGQGQVLQELGQSGYGVFGTNFSRYENPPENVDIRSGVDISQGLPFDDNSFDCVYMCDVIEHLPDHLTALKEMTRVTRNGGIMFILTPNTNRVSSRLHFLLTGFFKVKRKFIGFDVALEDSFVFHNYPPHLPTYLYLANSMGMQLLRFDFVGIKPKTLLMWAFLFPWIFVATWMKINLGENNLKNRPSGRMLLKTMTSFAALCGETAAIIHRKQPNEPLDIGLTTNLPSWSRKS